MGPALRQGETGPDWAKTSGEAARPWLSEKIASGQGWDTPSGPVPSDTGFEPCRRHAHLVCVSYPKNTGLQGGSEFPISG